MITSTATNQRGKFSIITYVIILSLLKVRLHTAIRLVRLVFWRIQFNCAFKVSLQFRFLELRHQMNFIRQNPNRTGQIAMCKRPVLYLVGLHWDSCPVDHTFNHCYNFCMIVKLINNKLEIHACSNPSHVFSKH
jgi:hypothetical protein